MAIWLHMCIIIYTMILFMISLRKLDAVAARCVVRMLFHLYVFVVRQTCTEQRDLRISLSHSQSIGLKNFSCYKNAQMKYHPNSETIFQYYQYWQCISEYTLHLSVRNSAMLPGSNSSYLLYVIHINIYNNNIRNYKTN